jgi:uncharacterized protein YegP (UPF0339 family)
MGDRDTLELYEDAEGDVRWRYKSAGNAKIMADGSEGYEDLGSALEGAYRVLGLRGVENDAVTASAGGEVMHASRGVGMPLVDVVLPRRA